MKRARCIRVDIAAQQDAAGKLLALGLRADETGQCFVANGDAAIRFWSEGLAELPDDLGSLRPGGSRRHPGAQQAHRRRSPRSRAGWTGSTSSSTTRARASASTATSCAAASPQGKKYVRLEDGSFAPFDADAVQGDARSRDRAHDRRAARTGELPLAQAGRVQELLQQAAGSSVTASARELFQKLAQHRRDRAAPRSRAPSRRRSAPTRSAGLSWLKFIHDIGSGGVLADDMGLGKTVQTIALLLAVKQEEKHVRALIVAPTSVVTNWERELARFSPTLTVALWHGAGPQGSDRRASREAEVVITSYALLRRDEEFLSSLDLTYAILDEAQHIKNPMSATAAGRQAPPRASAAWRSPARPSRTGSREIWSIFDFVSPGPARPARQVRAALLPAHRGGRLQDGAAPPRHHPPLHPAPHEERGRQGSAGEDRDRQSAISPAISGPIYQQVAREVRAQVLGEVERVGLAKSQLQILAGLTKLRQAACDPRLLGLPRDFTDEDSGKLVALRELVAERDRGRPQGARLQPVRDDAQAHRARR